MKKQIICAALVLAGVGLIVIGIRHGDTADVMKKAVMVCLECVGIG